MRNDIVDLISDLVAIDSVNPSLVPGGAGEREIAAFVAALGAALPGWRRRRSRRPKGVRA